MQVSENMAPTLPNPLRNEMNCLSKTGRVIWNHRWRIWTIQPPAPSPRNWGAELNNVSTLLDQCWRDHDNLSKYTSSEGSRTQYNGFISNDRALTCTQSRKKNALSSLRSLIGWESVRMWFLTKHWVSWSNLQRPRQHQQSHLNWSVFISWPGRAASKVCKQVHEGHLDENVL